MSKYVILFIRCGVTGAFTWGRKMASKNPKNKLKVSINIGSITKWIITGGIVCLIIGSIPFGSWDEKVYVTVIKDILQSLGTTLFSAGLVSVVLEISTVTEVVTKALNSIITDQFPFSNFSKKRLEDLHKQIAFLRLSENDLDEKDVEDSPYVLEPELLESSKGLYYGYHKASFIITPDNDKKVFRKRVDFDYQIINKLGLENSAKFTVSLICQKDNLSIDDVKSLFKIELFKIEESDRIRGNRRSIWKDLTKDAINYISISEVEPQAHSQYKYQIHFEYPLSSKLSSKIRIIYEYQIPQSDITQSYKLNYPSKTLEHEISMSGDGWEITGDAFTAFYFPDMYDKDYAVAQTVPTSIRVDFRDWAVPGAGYIVTFLKK